MSERTCPNCGETVPDAQYCAKCGRPMGESAEADETRPEGAAEAPAEATGAAPPLPADQRPTEEGSAELSGSNLPPHEPPSTPEPLNPPFAGETEERAEPAVEGVGPDEVEPRGPHHEPRVAGATPMQQAAEDARAPAPPVDGQLRCPNCGEAVYEGERVCWSCSRRLETVEQPAQQPESQAGAPPESGAPVSRHAPPRAGGAAQQAPSPAARPQPTRRPEPSAQAASYAWWSFGLGLLSVFTCGILGLLGVASLWLGISAARRDGGPVAIAGAVFGAIGLLMLLAWVIGLAIAMPQLVQPGPTHITIPGISF